MIYNEIQMQTLLRAKLLDVLCQCDGVMASGHLHLGGPLACRVQPGVPHGVIAVDVVVVFNP